MGFLSPARARAHLQNQEYPNALCGRSFGVPPRKVPVILKVSVVQILHLLHLLSIGLRFVYS